MLSRLVFSTQEQLPHPWEDAACGVTAVGVPWDTSLPAQLHRDAQTGPSSRERSVEQGLE